MNRTVGRWIKAGALIFIAALVVAACEGPAGPKGDQGDAGDTGPRGLEGPKGDTGDTGDQGETGDKGETGDQGETGDKGDRGEPGIGSVALGFSYAPFEGDPDEAPIRGLPSPVGDYVAENGGVPAHTAQAQCTMLTPDVDLYQWMAFGGTEPTHEVTMTQEVDEETVDVVHGFMIEPDDEGMLMLLSGQPDLAAGDYMWTLNANDSASDQHKSRSWKLKVTQEEYPTNEIRTTIAAEPAAGTERETGDLEWADFISSNYPGVPVGTDLAMHVYGGVSILLGLGETSGMGMVTGRVDPAVGEVADADVFWVGPLTPDSVLSVKIKGDTEFANRPGVFNKVNVALHSFVTDAEGKSAAEVADMSETEGYETTNEYMGPSCGNYYLEVSGEMGDYTLSWTFTE